SVLDALRACSSLLLVAWRTARGMARTRLRGNADSRTRAPAGVRPGLAANEVQDRAEPDTPVDRRVAVRGPRRARGAAAHRARRRYLHCLRNAGAEAVRGDRSLRLCRSDPEERSRSHRG